METWLAVLVTIGFAAVVYIVLFAGSDAPVPVAVSERLGQVQTFFTLLTDEKTATHVGSASMKSLRGMIDLPDLEPAILRAWSRAVRARAGTFLRVRAETARCQTVPSAIAGNAPLAQIVAEVEFAPVIESVDGREVTEAQRIQSVTNPVRCTCLLRFRDGGSARDAAGAGDRAPTTTAAGPAPRQLGAIIGFHVLPPQQPAASSSAPEPFDILSRVDPTQLDQFAERAVEALFDAKNMDDPMRGFWKFCLGPLQDLYDVASPSAKAGAATAADGSGTDNNNNTTTTTTTSSSAPAVDAAAAPPPPKRPQLPPRERRAKLAQDLLGIRAAMGLDRGAGRSPPPTVTMSDAELDRTAFPSARSVCARVVVTGPQRDCIVTLYVVLDASAACGCSVAKYSFALSANKQRMMVYDQDAGKPIGGC